MIKLIFKSIAMTFLLSSLVFADKQKTPYNHAFTNPVDKPDLPRVLIIGDSISIAYTPIVRKLLKEKANIHRPLINCRWSAFGETHVQKWLGDSKWDVIHFNFGLWDWYGWSQTVKATPESYAMNLDKIINKIKTHSKAKIIFAMTTPPCVGPERKVKIVVSDERAKKFNEAAQKVMIKHGVQVNDLYSLIYQDRNKYQRSASNVHYNEAGKELIASQVADVIKDNL